MAELWEFLINSFKKLKIFFRWSRFVSYADNAECLKSIRHKNKCTFDRSYRFERLRFYVAYKKKKNATKPFFFFFEMKLFSQKINFSSVHRILFHNKLAGVMTSNTSNRWNSFCSLQFFYFVVAMQFPLFRIFLAFLQLFAPNHRSSARKCFRNSYENDEPFLNEPYLYVTCLI